MLDALPMVRNLLRTAGDPSAAAGPRRVAMHSARRGG